jgi:hypothetical protein
LFEKILLKAETVSTSAATIEENFEEFRVSIESDIKKLETSLSYVENDESYKNNANKLQELKIQVHYDIILFQTVCHQ